MEFLTKHTHAFIELAIIVLIILVSFKLLNWGDKKIKQKLIEEKQSSAFLKFFPFLNKIIKAVILFIAFATILQNHGYSITSLIAGFGITGLAVGFAAKETIADVFGSFAILTDRVYDIGDYIEMDIYQGVVEEINLRSTKIRTLDRAVVVIPNGVAANAVVKNISRAKERRFDEIIDITYDTSSEKIERAQEIIKNIFKENDKIYNDFVVSIETLGESAIKIRAISYIKTNDWATFTRIKGEIIGEIIKKYREESIEFAFPSRTIYTAS